MASELIYRNDVTRTITHTDTLTTEFDPLLEEVLATHALGEYFYNYETPLLRATEKVELGAPFKSLKDEIILKKVLNIWGDAPTNKILDKVYFDTEPMAKAVRNEPLDFSTIPIEAPAAYKRTSSGVDPKEIQRRRAKFEADRRNAPQ